MNKILYIFISAGISALCLLLWKITNEKDAEFIALVIFFSLLAAKFFSPNRNLILGLTSIKSYDWITAIGFSGALAYIASNQSLKTALMLFGVLFIFAISCVIRIRR
ncbi:hypothetical protein PSm6_45210 [Pseudomonas solani]|uniref:Uncharacterized protein n=1 Tax=Pseudomonas solani TaxID=2731552 RepID=A0ABM7LES8_9PSED|nr:hypothetical protein PSm6_45210 [Pseudomonas solani]